MFLVRRKYHVYSYGISGFFICAKGNIMRWKYCHKISICLWHFFNYMIFPPADLSKIDWYRWEHHPWISSYHRIYCPENMIPSDSIHTRVCHEISKYCLEVLPMIFICIFEWFGINKKHSLITFYIQPFWLKNIYLWNQYLTFKYHGHF